MRMYTNPFVAFREVERDLWEMGIKVHPQTMQDKDVSKNPDYITHEVRAYGFQINKWEYEPHLMKSSIEYILTTPKSPGPHRADEIMQYIDLEFADRTGGVALNPGNAFKARQGLWNEFLHDGKFSYTYSERIAPQLQRVLSELAMRPNTRQGIINIHSNIRPFPGVVIQSTDLQNMGGGGRIPCSMYYQIMRRDGAVDLIYTMRSCDFLTHFPVDVALAIKLQTWFADHLKQPVGTFTYFTGSLHAYAKDLKDRGIF